MIFILYTMPHNNVIFMCFFRSQKWISKYFEQCKSTNVLKDAVKAAQYRKHGNEHFIKKRNIDALTLYNKVTKTSNFLTFIFFYFHQ